MDIYIYTTYGRPCVAIKTSLSTTPPRARFSPQIWHGDKKKFVRRKFSMQCRVVPRVRGGVQTSCCF